MSAILITHFYSEVMNIFVKVINKKLCRKSFFVINYEIKRKSFWRIVELCFLDIEKNFENTKFPTNFGLFELLEVTGAFQNWTKFGSN